MVKLQNLINICLFLTILGKIKETRLKVSLKKCNSLMKMLNFEEARVELTNTQLNN